MRSLTTWLPDVRAAIPPFGCAPSADAVDPWPPADTLGGGDPSESAAAPFITHTRLLGCVLHLGPHGPMVEIHQRASAEPILLALTQAEAAQLARRLNLLAQLHPGQCPGDTADDAEGARLP
ncbi:MAG: hypothetical protein MUE77_12145 [Sandarakinorhabdus sp.]|jgi:hypothetical protein|nr:hypothetical protein [Sandarakinorhabdus sp.]